MDHSFNTAIAKLVGTDCATVLHNIYYWYTYNKGNEKHLHDGTYWTYNSNKAFTVMFDYFTANQIERILKTLKDDGLILIGNYNATSYDRTRWFAPTEKTICIYENPQMELVETPNGIVENHEPIPNGKPILKPIIKQDINPVEIEFQELLKSRKLKGVKNTEHAIDLLRRRLEELAETDHEKIHILQRSILNGWTSVYKDNDYVPPFIKTTTCAVSAEPMDEDAMKMANDAMRGIYNG